MNTELKEMNIEENISKDEFIASILEDYKLACISREMSLLGRKEVLTGKAKFGIFGDGKEIAQIALAKQFKNGDFRSGYYRDQTFMMALGRLNIQEYFAGLYAHTDINLEPSSGGRQMGSHFSTRAIDNNGNWENLMDRKNSSADISPTAGQMSRLLGLAQASKVYRNNKSLKHKTKFSNNGNEVAFGTIGDASTSEGIFWESMNAASVMQVPMAISVWDDGYGISVPKKYQTTKESISEALSGFQKEKDDINGINIYKVDGWDYPNLVATYKDAINYCRESHTPVLIHVQNMTQPQGHSTSGSHERYKSKERLTWAKEFDCISKFKQWILSNNNALNSALSTEEVLNTIHEEAKIKVRDEAKKAWKAYIDDIAKYKLKISSCIEELISKSKFSEALNNIIKQIDNDSTFKDIIKALRKSILLTRDEGINDKAKNLLNTLKDDTFNRFNSHLYSEQDKNKIIETQYNDTSKLVDGRIILKENFRKLFSEHPELLTYGEDTGKIGGVNQTMEGLQEEFGKDRIFDTGIRENTIVGQGIGMALRGLRPIAEIQYLDYLLYCLQIMSDDLATLHYRTKGGQKAPLIIRTRGHRLEGIWHSGSPLGGIIHFVRGMIVCVPRNMTKAAGFYNLLINSDNPSLVIECLNGYRIKEKMPTNIGKFTTPIGIPEIVKQGTDITVVSYGSTFNLCEKASIELSDLGISCELIDVQTLLPFDTNHLIVESLKKTNKIIFIDEDVPGGATAFMLDEVINKQGGYYHLDAQPLTLTAQSHKPAYGTDGDYFSKPNIEDIVENIYSIMSEYNPSKFPKV